MEMLTPAADRGGARPLHHRAGRCQARRRRRLAESLPAAAAAGGDARRSRAQEHPDDGPDRRRQDRDCAPRRQDRRCPVRQSRGHPLHRSRLRRARRRVDRARSGRDLHRHALPAQTGAGERGGRSGREPPADRHDLRAAPRPGPGRRIRRLRQWARGHTPRDRGGRAAARARAGPPAGPAQRR